eukprot:6206476-Pleurochrysis_carterae.AAC.1
MPSSQLLALTDALVSCGWLSPFDAHTHLTSPLSFTMFILYPLSVASPNHLLRTFVTSPLCYAHAPGRSRHGRSTRHGRALNKEPEPQQRCLIHSARWRRQRKAKYLRQRTFHRFSLWLSAVWLGCLSGVSFRCIHVLSARGRRYLIFRRLFVE